MGLVMYPGDVRWVSPQELYDFLKAIAKSEGIELREMEGFKPWMTRDMRKRNYRGIPWDQVDTVFKPLLRPDDRMRISWQELEKMFPRLKEIVCEEWEPGNPLAEKGKCLLYAMEACIVDKTALEME